MLKEMEKTKGVTVETISDDRPEKAVDAEITSVKWSAPDGLNATSGAPT
jgi:hypothetical protein